ncbi:hypothetical protein EV193_102225 [Herbihabitans rhizosphaerae]|uniref:Uncharacterized protein n=1 Tax=Herbihabitans rhizosphaerae TaxID=1872711 RepID=A0A4Q7L2C8_9PSEU|nr:hypothetical protein EV193_102225 [Herbihabitans rhizosphaerae]
MGSAGGLCTLWGLVGGRRRFSVRVRGWATFGAFWVGGTVTVFAFVYTTDRPSPWLAALAFWILGPLSLGHAGLSAYRLISGRHSVRPPSRPGR